MAAKVKDDQARRFNTAAFRGELPPIFTHHILDSELDKLAHNAAVATNPLADRVWSIGLFALGASCSLLPAAATAHSGSTQFLGFLLSGLVALTLGMTLIVWWWVQSRGQSEAKTALHAMIQTIRERNPQMAVAALPHGTPKNTDSELPASTN